MFLYLNLDMKKFIEFCGTVKGLDRDNFDKSLLEKWTSASYEYRGGHLG